MWPLGLGAQPGLPALLAPGALAASSPGMAGGGSLAFCPRTKHSAFLPRESPPKSPVAPRAWKGLRPGAQLRSRIRVACSPRRRSQPFHR